MHALQTIIGWLPGVVHAIYVTLVNPMPTALSA
jgi:uncharacterized membrane protein YqaE (UPF0057 family)